MFQASSYRLCFCQHSQGNVFHTSDFICGGRIFCVPCLKLFRHLNSCRFNAGLKYLPRYKPMFVWLVDGLAEAPMAVKLSLNRVVHDWVGLALTSSTPWPRSAGLIGTDTEHWFHWKVTSHSHSSESQLSWVEIQAGYSRIGKCVVLFSVLF